MGWYTCLYQIEPYKPCPGHVQLYKLSFAQFTVRTKPGYFHFVGGDIRFSPTYLGLWEWVRKGVIWDHLESG